MICEKKWFEGRTEPELLLLSCAQSKIMGLFELRSALFMQRKSSELAGIPKILCFERLSSQEKVKIHLSPRKL